MFLKPRELPPSLPGGGRNSYMSPPSSPSLHYHLTLEVELRSLAVLFSVDCHEVKYLDALAPVMKTLFPGSKDWDSNGR